MRLGIDVGTCFSKAAFITDTTIDYNRKVTLLENPGNRSSYLHPSIIYVDPYGQILTGENAEEHRLSDPLNYRRNPKHFLWSRPEILRGKAISYETMMIAIISALLRECEQTYRQHVTSAVGTVPARYTQAQRDFMKRIYQKAGINQVQVIPGPLAVIESYALNHALLENEAILVYDLGGAFDAAIIRKKNAQYSCQSLPVSRNCGGGVDFELKIYGHIRSYLQEVQPAWDHFLDPKNNTQEASQARVGVRRACREIKQQLSTSEQCTISLDSGVADLTPVLYSLSRTEFEAMIDPFVQESVQHCKDLLHAYSIPWNGFSQVVMTGGSTNIPLIETVLKKHFPQPVNRVADTTVEAQGAAIYGDRVAASFLRQTGEQLVKSFFDLLDSWTYEYGVSILPMTYKEAIGYFATHQPSDPRVQKGAMLQQFDPYGQGIIFTQVFLDEKNRPVLQFNGIPYGRKLLVSHFDQELREAFGSRQVVFVE